MAADTPSERAPRLSACEARRLIAQVHAEDVARARANLDAAVRAAEEQWVPVDAIADAMLIALPEIAHRCLAVTRLAAGLEALAAQLRERASTPFHA